MKNIIGYGCCYLTGNICSCYEIFIGLFLIISTSFFLNSIYRYYIFHKVKGENQSVEAQPEIALDIWLLGKMTLSYKRLLWSSVSERYYT